MIIVQNDNNMKRKQRVDTYWMVQCIQGLWGGEHEVLKDSEEQTIQIFIFPPCTLCNWKQMLPWLMAALSL